MASLVGFEQHDGLFSPGGSISNMYGMLLARYRAFPEIKVRVTEHRRLDVMVEDEWKEG